MSLPCVLLAKPRAQANAGTPSAGTATTGCRTAPSASKADLAAGGGRGGGRRELPGKGTGVKQLITSGATCCRCC